MRNIVLPSSHYAARWSSDIMRTPSELTALGRQYAELPLGTPKEDKLLEIVQCFHGYLLKYLATILRGHIPFRGGEVNKDTNLLLQHFIPKGTTISRASLGTACRTLHLAFKGMDQAEVYDQLMMCVVKSVKMYDPFYTQKVKVVVDVVRKDLIEKNTFTAHDVSAHTGSDATRYLRLLSKRLFLVSHPATEQGEARFSRADAWPPPASFFEGGPVGLTYFISKWFRYFLIDWISWRMGEIETKEGVLQLEHRRIRNTDQSLSEARESITPHLGGELTNARTGRSVSADMTLANFPFDVGRMNLDWVMNKADGVFGSLTREERYLLYCIYAREMDWQDVADNLQI
jgi:hypothetical protein